MSIDLTNLRIQKVVIHTIPERGPDRTPAKPIYATKVINLPPEAAASVRARITEALGKSSHSIEVSLVDHAANSFGQIGASLMHANDLSFLKLSAKLAEKLARAQVNRDLAASKLIIATGLAGAGSKRFLLAIKAEMQDGFTESADEGIEHLTELFLTPSQKLFKMGIMSEEVAAKADDGLYNLDHYAARLFDHLLNATETREAAHYFYSLFLGAEPIISDKRLTRDFYELTKQFINSARLGQDEKADLLEALRVDLKSKSGIIHVRTFAEAHMEEDERVQYVAFMKEQDFPRTGVTKDTEFVRSRLSRKQRIRFQHGVELTAPADKLRELVHIDKEVAGKTVVTILGSIEQQE
jgi:hypothetical protein